MKLRPDTRLCDSKSRKFTRHDMISSAAIQTPDSKLVRKESIFDFSRKEKNQKKKTVFIL